MTETVATYAAKIRACLTTCPESSAPAIATATGITLAQVYVMIRSMKRRTMVGETLVDGVKVYRLLRAPKIPMTKEQLKARYQARQVRYRAARAAKRREQRQVVREQRLAARAEAIARGEQRAKPTPGVALAAYRQRQAAQKAARQARLASERRGRVERLRTASATRSQGEQPTVGTRRPELCTKPAQSYEDWLAQGNRPEVLPGPSCTLPRQIPAH